MTGRRRLLAATVAGALGAVASPRSSVAARAPTAEPSDGSSAASIDSNAPFAFALIGDLPYNALEVRVLEAVLASFDDDVDFALHVGDLKASWEPCSDTLLDRRLALLESGRVPLVYVPGDNEWTDCGRSRAGGFDPRERLDWLRRRAFGGSRRAADPLHATALPVLPAIERHSEHFEGGLPENLRWSHRNVRFVTLNLPGSNNGLKAGGLDRGDWERRMRANSQWLLDTYRRAAEEAAMAIVVAAHANPQFGARRRSPWSTDGYAAFRSQLTDASNAFGGPTLFVHGDTHHHRVERITAKLLRVESYGSPFSDRWVRIDVVPGASEAFRITARAARLANGES